MRLLHDHHSPTHKEADDVFLLYTFMAAALVLMAGLMSGLTLGLLSLDAVDLEVSQSGPPRPRWARQMSSSVQSGHLVRHVLQVLKRSGTPTERQYAAKIAPVSSLPQRCIPIWPACTVLMSLTIR